MNTRQRREYRDAMLFLSPNLLGFAVFMIFPLLASLVLSVFRWDIITWPPTFVGLDHFIKLVGWHWDVAGAWAANDPLFWTVMGNTLFLMLAIPLQIVASLALAWALTQRLRLMTTLRTIFFLPSICSIVAIAMLWTWLYNPETGPINYAIAQAGQWLRTDWQGPLWLTDTAWAKPALIIMTVWMMAGGLNMVLYMAALKSIPQELYEAAEIDGAGTWSTFWAVTWPMISPTTFYILTMSLVGAFQGGFIGSYIMTRGGPHNATRTLEYYIFDHLFTYQEAGYAAAIAWVLFSTILAVTLLNWWFGKKWVWYGT